MNVPRKSTTHDERFFHVPVTEFSPLYSHVTLFFRKEEFGWRWAYALCSRADQFCRKRGRTVARRRYFERDCRHLIKAGKSEPTLEDAQAIAKGAVDYYSRVGAVTRELQKEVVGGR